MDYMKVGGACLLFLILAAALPTNILAQTPETQTSPVSGSDAAVSSGSTPTLSKSQLMESSGEGTIVSAENLARRNTGLKPLAKPGMAAAPATSGPTAQAQSAAASAPESNTALPSQEAAVTAGASQATPETEVTPTTTSLTEASTTQTSPQTVATTSPATETTVTPDMISQETETAQETSAPSITPETITPSEIVLANESENASETVPKEETVSEEEANAEEESDENAAEEKEGTDRIWREGISPLVYAWTPQTFSGFFYDLKNDVGTEKLTVTLQESDRSIESGDLTYSTSAESTDFEFGDWGTYQVIGFMADKYFAGYTANELFDSDTSLINDGQLRKVLMDSDDESSITTGSVMPLEEGYELRIKQIDINGNKVYLSLAKDGDEVDSKVISPDNLKSATYQYKVDISGKDVPIVMAHISNVFTSTESALVTVDGIFQISDTYASVEEGDSYGKMEVNSVSDEGIEMDNDGSITLRKGSESEIFGDVVFLVADADEIRFAPFVKRSGTYDVRGTVINPSETSEFTWTPYNFEGFYYDIDDDVGTESLEVIISGGTKIDEEDLTYKTLPQPVKFEFDDWGKYDVIGFMADKYFAGYNNATEFADEASIINEGELRKVLIDSDDSQTIGSGSVFALEEGYELRIKQVDLNGNKVYLSLAKDGKEVDSKVVTPGSDPTDRASNYRYLIDAGSVEDVPIIVAHIQSVFRSTEADLATVDGLFQISDTAQSVEEGEVHGKMKVETLGDDGITMKNDGSISLGRNKVIEIMENLKLEVADSDDRLLAPIATKTGEGEGLTLSVPDALVNKSVSIVAKSGSTALSGVQISINEINIGGTDASGSISYMPTSTGTYQVVAKKSGYNDAKANLIVRTAAEAASLAAVAQANATLANTLTINAPLEVAKGENFLISVVEGINQTPVGATKVFLDENVIGNTSSQGTLTYSTNVTGEHILKAEKEGFNSNTKKITVISGLKVLSLEVPDKASVGKEMKISARVQNTAKQSDSRSFELKLNDTVLESKNVSMKAGENSTITFSYKPKNTGLHKFSLDDKNQKVNVEKAQSNTWLIALVLVLLIAIGAGYYLHTTGELNKLQDQIKKLMQGR